MPLGVAFNRNNDTAAGVYYVDGSNVIIQIGGSKASAKLAGATAYFTVSTASLGYNAIPAASAASTSEPVVAMPVQTNNFVATAGQSGVEHLWPVDVSANAATSTLLVTAPSGTPAAGDRFSVSDVTLSCSLTRIIRVEFSAQPIMSLPAPDFAVINSAGAKITFTYIDASRGWEIAANINA